jgi:hypothetical protein
MSEFPETELSRTTWQGAVSTVIRLLTFRASREELTTVNGKHLVIGLLCTWLVGMGRYWDNPRVHLPQQLGVGSIVYVFVLSLFLWLIVWPLRPKNWSYFRVLVFVTLVSPPAIIYAFPVEKFYSLDTANSLNQLFLLIVATWRVALLLFFLRRVAELSGFATTIAAMLPLTLIVVTLTILNLEKVVFDFMGGVINRTSSDASYDFLTLLSVVAILLIIPLLVCYVALAWAARVEAHQERYKKLYGE